MALQYYTALDSVSLINPYKTLSQRRPWAARSILALLIIFIFLLLIRLSLSFAIKFGAITWLESQQIEASIGRIEISLADGSFAINDVSGKNKTGKGFSLNHLEVSWGWKPLLNHLAIIEEIDINGLYIDAMFFENGNFNIAGLAINKSDTDQPSESAEQQPSTPWDVTLKNISLSDINLCVQQISSKDELILDYCGAVANFTWTGKLDYKPSIQPDSKTPLPIYLQGSVHIQDIALHNNQLKLNLLTIQSVDVNNINIDTPMAINADSLGIDNFSALQRATRTSADDAQLFAFGHLKIQPIKFTQLNKLSLGTIELTDASAYLLVNQGGHMDYANWLPEKDKHNDAQDESTDTTSDPFNFDFDEFIFISDQHFIFTDHSLKEPFTADIHPVNLKVTRLDSSAPEKTSRLSLSLSLNTHGSFKLDTDLTPLSEKPSVKGTIKISGFDLRMLAPLTKQHIGHNIKSGQLDADMDLNINKGNINSNMSLALHQFELKMLNKQDAEELNSEFGFPLNSSLSLLRDQDNTIRLDIPVTGDINHPDFNPRDAFVKASSKAITTTVVLYYSPFGLVMAADGLINLATAINFEPVLFNAGNSSLKPLHEEQLKKIAVLMAKRPGIHLTLCGISNDSDKKSLFPGSGELLAKENLAALKTLAETRSANIKNYLVDKETVDASRLIECSPEFLPDDISGVEISL